MLKTYKYTNKAGKIEQVEPVRWRWIAHYKNGKTIHQYKDSDGSFHQIKEIDRVNLVAMQMVSDSNPHGVTVEIPAKAEMVHYYRNIRSQEFNSIHGLNPDKVSFVRMFIFGWKKAMKLESGKEIMVKRLLMIMPNDRIRIIDEDGRNN